MNAFAIVEKELDIELMKAEALYENAINMDIIAMFENDEFTEGVADTAKAFFDKAGKLMNDIIEAIKKFFKELADKLKNMIEEKKFSAKVAKLEEEIKVTPELGTKKVDYSDPKVRVTTFNEMLKEVAGLASRLKKATTHDEIESVNSAIDNIIGVYNERLDADTPDKVQMEAVRVVTKLKSEVVLSHALLNQVADNTEKTLRALEETQKKEAEEAAKEAWKKLPVYKKLAIIVSSTSKKVGKKCSEHPFITFTAIAAVGFYADAQRKSTAKINGINRGSMDKDHPNVKKIVDAYKNTQLSETQYDELMQKEANRQAKKRHTEVDADNKAFRKEQKEAAKAVKKELDK